MSKLIIVCLLSIYCSSLVYSAPAPASSCTDENGQPGFKCLSDSTCIQMRWYCDAGGDCADESDEPDDCIPVKVNCTSTQFKCNDGECLEAAAVCDGVPDCGAEEDEAGCEAKPCAKGSRKCADGKQCIKVESFCDRSADCSDGSDEKNCDGKWTKQCDAEQTTCTSGICILSQYVCDGGEDCDDGSDEKGCETRACLPGLQKCGDKKTCRPKELFCDRRNDCGDASDEQGCDGKWSLAACDATAEMTCANGVCIDQSFKCDGADDCGDNSDEKGCPATVQPPTQEGDD